MPLIRSQECRIGRSIQEGAGRFPQNGTQALKGLGQIAGRIQLDDAGIVDNARKRQHKLAIKVARIFNTYGPRMHPNDGRVVSNFIVQALLGRDITVFGDGLQTRSFCYVDDLIDGLKRLMNTPNEVIGPINLGNPKEFTILELASLVIELTGSRSRIVHRPRPQDDPRQRQRPMTCSAGRQKYN